MPTLERVHHSLFIGNTFTDIAGSQYQGSSGLHGIGKLLEFTAAEAFHDSAERSPPPKCHPETRKFTLSRILDWILGAGSTSQRVLWLHGPAGAGKSAISQTISETTKARGLLAATFFFSRGGNRRGSIQFFISTIAYQLCLSIPALREILDTIIAKDPSIFQKSIQVQLEKLIVEPFISLAGPSPPSPHNKLSLVIVDGLDECAGDDDQCVILNHITHLVATHNLPLIFLVASRREPHIEKSFKPDTSLGAISVQIFLEPSEGEIRTFVKSGFSAIRRNHDVMVSVPDPWPSNDQVERLVQRSSGYFIYASTVLKFVDDPDRHPDEQLSRVLSGEPAPFAELDELYHQILSTIADPALLVHILRYTLVARDSISPSMIGDLLGLSPGKIQLTLRRMTPLLEFSGDHDGIFFIHASFLDLICSQHRGRQFYIDETQARLDLTRDCLKHMQGWMKVFPFLAHQYLHRLFVLPDNNENPSLTSKRDQPHALFRETMTDIHRSIDQVSNSPDRRKIEHTMKFELIVLDTTGSWGLSQIKDFSTVAMVDDALRPQWSSFAGFEFQKVNLYAPFENIYRVTVLFNPDRAGVDDREMLEILFNNLSNPHVHSLSKQKIVYVDSTGNWPTLRVGLGTTFLDNLRILTASISETPGTRGWSFIDYEKNAVVDEGNLGFMSTVEATRSTLVDCIQRSTLHYESSLNSDISKLQRAIATTRRDSRSFPFLRSLLDQQSKARLESHDQVMMLSDPRFHNPHTSQCQSLYFSLARNHAGLTTDLTDILQDIQSSTKVPIGTYLLHAMTGFSWYIDYQKWPGLLETLEHRRSM